MLPKNRRQDYRRVIGKLTLRKLWNAALVYGSYFYARWRKKPIQGGLPFTLSLEPTTACNLRCPECPSGLRQFSRATGNLKQDFFRQLIEERYRELIYLIFYFQGEPYINPDFLDMVKYAHEKGIYTITSTNGHFLSEANVEKTLDAGLDRMIISVDGTTQATYEQYRKGGQLKTVLEGAKRMVAAKKRRGSSAPYIIFQFLVVRPNEHQIPEIYRIAEEIGVDEVRLKTAQLYDYKQGHPLMPKNEQYSRYIRQADGSYRPRHALVNHCWRLWHTSVITWDGRVVPCCFDKDAQHQMGNLQNQSFKDIWQGPAYQHFRTQLFKGRDQIDICTNCTEGCKVWAKKT